MRHSVLINWLSSPLAFAASCPFLSNILVITCFKSLTLWSRGSFAGIVSYDASIHRGIAIELSLLFHCRWTCSRCIPSLFRNAFGIRPWSPTSRIFNDSNRNWHSRCLIRPMQPADGSNYIKYVRFYRCVEVCHRWEYRLPWFRRPDWCLSVYRMRRVIRLLRDLSEIDTDIQLCTP